ncbi:hypothetical protein GA0115237_1030178 [Streptomyces sp. ScaeMP-6W]|nr:hypothetical protein GA0115237_1030178 [Streptomyces sp. ScaeMP-6W]
MTDWFVTLTPVISTVTTAMALLLRSDRGMEKVRKLLGIRRDSTPSRSSDFKEKPHL